MPSIILTEELAEQAVDLVRPALNTLLGSNLVEGYSNLHLIILKFGTEDILYEESFGDRSSWEAPYDAYARAKARLCQRTGMINRTILTDAPWMLETGATLYSGGVIENGLVVACSGLQDHFDEMISWWVVSAIQALCRDRMAYLTRNEVQFLL